MKYLIIGRSGVGKDYLARKLCERGLTMVKSYATRPKRYETEDTHIFITPEEAVTFTDKVAKTTINGYEYFATRKQVEDADLYIIDPNGAKELVQNMPDTPFGIVYVCADEKKRYKKAIKRGNKKEQKEIFTKRQESENVQFSVFENDLINGKGVFECPNVVIEKEITNFYTSSYMEKEAELLSVAMNNASSMEIGKKYQIIAIMEEKKINVHIIEE